MKRVSIFIATAMLSGMFLASCGGGESPKEVKEVEAEASVDDMMGDEAPTGAMETAVDVGASIVGWTGSMVGVYDHTGTINILEGMISMENGTLSGGSFTIDMNSITPLDENYGEDNPKEKLVGHLGSADFFDIAANPTSNFVMTGMDLEAGTISGDLTVKGVTNAETLTDVTLDKETATATANLVFNRQTYGVSYASTMKDMVLSDDITLNITLKLAM